MTRFELTLSALALGAAMLGTTPAFASDTFPLFVGEWAGEGTISWKSDGSKERMKCAVSYALGSSSDQLSLTFDCRSDNYIFNLDGKIEQNGDNVKGQWSERSRNIGGGAIGQAKGDRIRLRIESSSAFYANLQIVVKKDRQQVQIKSAGAGEEALSEFTLKRLK
jgi:hypothetical protein